MTIRYSVVVPAYRECGNLDALVRRVFAAMRASGFAGDEVEMLIVDDNSRDGSVEVVQQLQKEGYAVDILVRTHERGLSSAVICGLQRAHGACMVVMDADLQHPPEVVPQLFRALLWQDVEFVCGTRYGAGTQIDKHWPLHRRVISWGARMLARPLTSLSDPMSGFFGLRKTTLAVAEPRVNPIGYKIALELFVKAHVRRYEEVGFNFAARTYGESKLTSKVIVNYLQHLRTLYLYKYGKLVYVALVAAVLLVIVVLYTFCALLF